MTPLVRTEGKTYQSGYALSVDRLLAEEPLQVESRDATARAAEAALGLPPSLCFCVGHACPAFGAIVLVYEFEQLGTPPGSATDHDTGGLHAGHVHFEPELTADERRRWSESPAHRWPLADLPTQFSRYVSEWFEGVTRYFAGGRAARNDPEGRLLHSQNERRAWTVEVRFERDQPLLADALRLIGLAPAAYEAIRHATTINPGAHPAWERLLDAKTVRAFEPATMHADVERLIETGALS